MEQLTRWNASKLPQQLAHGIVRHPSENQIAEGLGVGLTSGNAFKKGQSLVKKPRMADVSQEFTVLALHFFVFCYAALVGIAWNFSLESPDRHVVVAETYHAFVRMRH